MTKGGRRLLGTESTFDTCSVVLSHTFAWTDRRKVLDAFSEVLKVDPQKWIFGGAYLFWAQPMDSCRGEAIYIGETADFVTRLRSHLIGPADRGNKHAFLAKQFEGTNLIAGLALLVVSPDQLDYHDSPYGPVFENDVNKRAAERLESLLLRAHLNWKGRVPRGNTRGDASKAAHPHEGARLVTLLRFLYGNDDGWGDYVHFDLPDQAPRARETLTRHLSQCLPLSNAKEEPCE